MWATKWNRKFKLTYIKKKKKSEKFLKGAEGQTEDVEIFGKLKLLQITYQRYDMTE